MAEIPGGGGHAPYKNVGCFRLVGQFAETDICQSNLVTSKMCYIFVLTRSKKSYIFLLLMNKSYLLNLGE